MASKRTDDMDWIDTNHSTMTGDKVNLGNIYDDAMMNIRIIDTSTGKPINISHFQDTSRMSDREEEIDRDSSTVYTNVIPNNLLDQFVVSKREHFNARSCVEALGMYCTERIKTQITTLGSKQDSYTDIEDKSVLSSSVFTQYVKGGMSPRDIATGQAKEIVDKSDSTYNRISGNLGIGLGESTVLNPTFQFNKRDDPRTNPMSTKIGRVYSTTIMNNWPIILFQPGRLKYNTGYMKTLGLFGGAGMADAYIRSGGEGIKGIVSGAFTALGDLGGIVGTLGSAIFGSGKMVEFRQARNLYDKYLRTLLDSMASMMGLFGTDMNGNMKYTGAIENLDLTHILPVAHMTGGGDITKYLNEQFLPFRIHKGMIGSETFNNTTETNPLQEEMNAASTENAEEGKANGNILQAAKKWFTGALGAFSDKYAVLSGNGKIALPDVYSSSSFSRSVTCSFQFHYPYGDPLGKFENIFLQMIMLLTLGIPRQTGRMTYTTPFATRVFVKNHIFIPYGMIESITITRGADANDWCPDGYPKTVKVDVQIKDMEPNISLPLAARGPTRMFFEQMFPTTGLTEYLMSIAGASLDSLTHSFRKDHLTNATNVFMSGWGNILNKEAIMSKVTNNRYISSFLNIFNAVDVTSLNKLGDINNIAATNANEAMIQSKFFDAQQGLFTMFTGGGSTALNESVVDQNEVVTQLQAFGAELLK